MTKPIEFTLFKNTGHLTCVSSTYGQKLMSYPGPYAIMVTESNTFDTGGGEYLCSMNNVTTGSKNSEYQAISKPAPDYPVSFFEDKKSGYVIAEYTILEDGSTSDIRVLETDVSDVFTEKALESVGLYEYKPRIINGISRKVYGVRTRFNFVREDGK